MLKASLINSLFLFIQWIGKDSRMAVTTLERLSRLPYLHHIRPALRQGLLSLGLFLILSGGYIASGRPVNLIIDDRSYQARVHDPTVAAIIQDLGLALEPEDRVTPALDAALRPGETLTIALARPVIVEADGHYWRIFTHRRQASEVLTDLGLAFHPRDELFINGQPGSLEALLPEAQPGSAPDAAGRLFATASPGEAVKAARPEAVRLNLYRAVPVTLHDEQTQNRFYTARQTVGEALAEQGLTLFEADQVTPSPETHLSPEMHIYIKRSIPVTIVADGQVSQTRTHEETVGDFLAREGFALMGQDYTRPALDQPLSGNETIEIIRVREALEIEEEFIPFETEWIADESMELDQQQVRQTGVTGVIKTRARVRYEDEHEVERMIEDEWLDRSASTRVVAYGTQVVVRTLQTEKGPIQYWRKIPMLATSYNAATSGKALDHPQYGITRSGMTAGYGIVAVDPKVIPLRTQLYIPGYGPAVAGDTGGLILGKHIDLGFDDGAPPPTIYGWRDVYVLTPVPPAGRIRYVLPQWPQR
jgi:uncharacterized protein YabE (DUF348 family)